MRNFLLKSGVLRIQDGDSGLEAAAVMVVVVVVVEVVMVVVNGEL